MKTRMEDLHFALKGKYGDNFTGVTKPLDPKKPVQLCWATPPDATTLAEAQQMADKWDWTEKPDPTDADVEIKFSKLKSVDKDKLFDALLKQFLLTRPDLLDQIQ